MAVMLAGCTAASCSDGYDEVEYNDTSQSPFPNHEYNPNLFSGQMQLSSELCDTVLKVTLENKEELFAIYPFPMDIVLQSILDVDEGSKMASLLSNAVLLAEHNMVETDTPDSLGIEIPEDKIQIQFVKEDKLVDVEITVKNNGENYHLKDKGVLVLNLMMTDAAINGQLQKEFKDVKMSIYATNKHK